MSNPASSVAKGRGRGRKELSASERVNQWVNQREAKRLNKERWTSRDSGDSSPIGERRHGSDYQVSSTQGASEEDSSLDRSKEKRQDVPFYVPPSLRENKEFETNKGSHMDSFTGAGIMNEGISQKSDVALSAGLSMGGNIKPEHEDLQHTPSEARRPKGRGRGRKKPDVEIYVPRAMRATKQENKPGVQARSGTDTVFKTGSPGDDSSQNTDIPSPNFSSQCSVSSEAMSYHVSDSDTPSHKLHSDNRFNNPSIVRDSQSSLADDDLAAKKVKHEPNDSSKFQFIPDNSASAAREEQSFMQSHIEGIGYPLTFEFYDPAVVAFLPSQQSVHQSGDTNNSFYTDNSKESLSDLQIVSSLTQNKSSDYVPSVQASQQSQMFSVGNERQPHAAVNTDKDLIFSGKMEAKEEEKDSHRRIDSLEPDVGDKDGCVSNEHAAIVGFSGSAEGRKSKGALDVSVPVHAGDPEQNEDFSDEQLHNSSAVAEEAAQLGFSSEKLHDAETKADEPVQRPGAGDSQVSDSKITISDSKQGENSEYLAEDGEDSWDNLFDDNGDCLDETLMRELTEYVGKVEIDKPKINYLNYEPKEPELDLQAFSHILEIYDFSPELGTCDLISAFREFSSRGFDVKWVDDTHALGIFSSAIAANEALKMFHPLLKVRPMSEASKKGQNKARHCQEFLQPYKARPETTSIAARRLVAGALGMAPKVSREVREQERKKLKEVKEKRRQERQQKVDVWEGTIGKCAMDEVDTEGR